MQNITLDKKHYIPLKMQNIALDKKKTQLNCWDCLSTLFLLSKFW